MSKNLFNKIFLFMVIGFLIIIAPREINAPSQSVINAICTGIAIDKEENLNLTAQILLSQAGGQYTQSMTVVTSQGDDLMEAFRRLEAYVGKKVNLSHCFYIIIGEEFSKTNLASSLDYLMRGSNGGTNTFLIQAKGKASDMLNMAASANSSGIDSIQTLLKYNDRYLSSSEANLKSFYNDYLSPHKTSFVTLLDTFPQDESSSGQSGQNEGNGGNSVIKEKIKNDGSCAVFYKGALATILTPQERSYFDWFDNKLSNSIVEIKNVNDKTFTNATLGYTIINKGIKYNLAFVGNKPCIYISYDLKLKPEMFLTGDGEVLQNSAFISAEIERAFQQKISLEIDKAMQIQKEYGFDVFNFYKMFNIRLHTEWQDYLESLNNPEDYIKGIEVYCNVKCSSKV